MSPFVFAGMWTGILLAAGPGAEASPVKLELRPEKIHLAEARKNQAYVKDGLIVGGDRAIDDVVVKNIRRAPNSGFERWVIDLEGNRSGEPAAIQRPPYFQVAVTPDEKRLIFTLWGKPKLGFDSRKTIAALKKSPLVEDVALFPRLEDERWMFAINLKSGRPIEVFELSNPVRIIVDIKSDERQRRSP